jgi:hypothetical protein
MCSLGSAAKRGDASTGSKGRTPFAGLEMNRPGCGPRENCPSVAGGPQAGIHAEGLITTRGSERGSEIELQIRSCLPIRMT